MQAQVTLQNLPRPVFVSGPQLLARSSAAFCGGRILIAGLARKLGWCRNRWTGAGRCRRLWRAGRGRCRICSFGDINITGQFFLTDFALPDCRHSDNWPGLWSQATTRCKPKTLPDNWPDACQGSPAFRSFGPNTARADQRAVQIPVSGQNKGTKYSGFYHTVVERCAAKGEFKAVGGY